MQEKETFMDKLGKVITMAGTAILMNLLFLVACLPIVTIGQAWCGLLSAIRYNIRGDSWFEGFKKGFSTRFLRGTLAWLVLLVVDVLVFIDVLTFAAADGYTARLIGACVMFAAVTMMTAAVLILNVYIPTDIGNWLRNSASMVFKVPLQLLVVAAVMWLPVIMAFFWTDIFMLVWMIFVAVYFTLAALGSTILLKEALMAYLVEARAEGTLLAEEGAGANQKKAE